MQRIRPAACAGTFYPGEANALKTMLSTMLEDAEDSPVEAEALIVPHAGFIYSGAVAASAYARISGFEKVVLRGPAHRIPFMGIAYPESDAFETPCGRVKIAPLSELGEIPGLMKSELAHAYEHSLEVQLPFLHAVLGEFTLIPLLVGGASAVQVSATIERFLGEPGTLVVVSSDLSHFHCYEEARRIDSATASSILSLEPGLDHERACGAIPVNALLHASRKRGLAPNLLDMKNSGDTAGDRNRVVGYASFSFSRRT